MQSKLLNISLILTLVGGMTCISPVSNAVDTKKIGEDQIKAYLKKNPGEIESIIKKYIKKNPSLIYESLVDLQKQKIAKQKQDINSFLHKNSKALFDNANDGVVGNTQGKTTILVMSDYQCGYCRKAASTLDKMVKKFPQLKVAVKQLPILGADSVKAAKTAMLANDKKIFKEVNAKLNALDKPMNKQKLSKLMGSFKIDNKTFEKALSSKKYDKNIQENFSIMGKIAAQGTPVLIIANKDRSKIEFVENFLDEKSLAKQIQKLS